MHDFDSTSQKQELAFAKPQDSRQEGEATRSRQFEAFLAKISQSFFLDLQDYTKCLLETEERQEQEYQSRRQERPDIR